MNIDSKNKNQNLEKFGDRNNKRKMDRCLGTKTYLNLCVCAQKNESFAPKQLSFP